MTVAAVTALAGSGVAAAMATVAAVAGPAAAAAMAADWGEARGESEDWGSTYTTWQLFGAK